MMRLELARSAEWGMPTPEGKPDNAKERTEEAADSMMNHELSNWHNKSNVSTNLNILLSP